MSDIFIQMYVTKIEQFKIAPFFIEENDEI